MLALPAFLNGCGTQIIPAEMKFKRCAKNTLRWERNEDILKEPKTEHMTEFQDIKKLDSTCQQCK
jgi:hypothetical protein